MIDGETKSGGLDCFNNWSESLTEVGMVQGYFWAFRAQRVLRISFLVFFVIYFSWLDKIYKSVSDQLRPGVLKDY